MWPSPYLLQAVLTYIGGTSRVYATIGAAYREGVETAETSADMSLIAAIRTALRAAADPARAEPMRRYMKSDMPFLGVVKAERTRSLRPMLRVYQPADKQGWEATIRTLWDGAQFREERYAAIHLAQLRSCSGWATNPDSLVLYRHMIVTGAWWDHVDDLAIHSVGPVLRAGHDAVAPVVDEWSRHPDRWLRRAAVICQVGAKAGTDVDLLAACVLANADDSDFFLRKGIGWALRQHSRTDPDWVRAFVDEHADRLAPLSRREALRHLPPTRFPSPVTDE